MYIGAAGGAAEGLIWFCTPRSELRALAAVLAAAGAGQKIVNWPEFFSATAHAPLLRELEAGLMQLNDEEWTEDEAETEFVDGWSNLANAICRAQLAALNDKARTQPLSFEDKDRYRRLLEAQTASHKCQDQ